MCFKVWSRSSESGRVGHVWAIGSVRSFFYDWVNTANPYGVANDHFSGRGVYGCLRRVLSILTHSQIFMALK